MHRLIQEEIDLERRDNALWKPLIGCTCALSCTSWCPQHLYVSLASFNTQLGTPLLLND